MMVIGWWERGAFAACELGKDWFAWLVCRVGTGLELCSPADSLQPSPWPRQALTSVSLLSDRQAPSWAGIPAQTRAKWGAEGSTDKDFIPAWCDALSNTIPPQVGECNNVPEPTSELWLLTVICTGQRGLGVLCGAIHLTLQCETQGVSLFPAPHCREGSPFLIAHFVSCSVADAASHQRPLLLKLWRFYLVKRYQVSNSCCRRRRERTWAKSSFF